MAELKTIEDVTSTCCSPTAQETCCDPSAKSECCAEEHPDGCGCSAGRSKADEVRTA